MNWTETNISRALAFQFFNRKYLCVVPNCSWPGAECDLLCVTENLRIIDVEIKISRADLKVDAKKEKWRNRPYNWPFTTATGGYALRGPPAPDLPRTWPRKVWKHYYAMPAEIWTDALLDAMPSPASGVLLLDEHNGLVRVKVRRPAKPDRNADKLSPEAAVNIARLASLRMWETYRQIDQMRAAA